MVTKATFNRNFVQQMNTAEDFVRQLRLDMQNQYPDGEWVGDEFYIPEVPAPTNDEPSGDI